MFASTHPDYPAYLIRWGKDGQKPVAGNFYAPTKDDNLSHIASKACGSSAAWRNINRNVWNKANLVYRPLSTGAGCYKAKVNPALADKTWNPSQEGAYIALCQNDTSARDKEIGSKYPILWIPPNCGDSSSISVVPEKEKEIIPETKPAVDLKIVKLPTYIPTTLPKIDIKPITTLIKKLPSITPISPLIPTGPTNIPTGPTAPTVGPDTKPYAPNGGPSYIPDKTTPAGPTEAKAGFRWWLWLLMAGGLLTAAAAKKKKKGKGKGKKKKKKGKKGKKRMRATKRGRR